MIKEITYPRTEEEWYVKGTFTVGDRDIYFEIPAIFVDGVLDQAATEVNVSNQIESLTKYYEKLFNIESK